MSKFNYNNYNIDKKFNGQMILKLGAELSIKSNRVRTQFLKQLKINLKLGLKIRNINAVIVVKWSFLEMYYQEDELEIIADLCNKTMGVSSYSRVLAKCENSLEAILDCGVDLYKDQLQDKSFSVRAKRSTKVGFSSLDVCKSLGSKLIPFARKVDLTNPQVEVLVALRNEGAVFYSSPEPGCHGLPIATAGKALCLLSGGFDSIVAAWLMQKRGVAIDFVFCNLAGEDYLADVYALAKGYMKNYGHGYNSKLYVIDFNEVVCDIKKHVKPAYAQVVLKRQFYRVADDLCLKNNVDAVITGECLAQVSSQTLKNLVAISAISPNMYLRPLISFDKNEIIDIARKIDTFNVSAKIKEYCQLVQDKPITATTIEKLDEQEEKLSIDVMSKCLANMREISLVGSEQKVKKTKNMSIKELSSLTNSIWIDCSSKSEFSEWHYKGALNVELFEITHALSLKEKSTKKIKLNKDISYILYCTKGLQSAVAVQYLIKEGYNAFGVHGGTESLKKHLHNFGGTMLE